MTTTEASQQRRKIKSFKQKKRWRNLAAEYYSRAHGRSVSKEMVWGFSIHLTGKEGFPGGSGGKNPPANARSPGKGHGNPLQCSCQENPMDRGAWWAPVHSVAKSQT